MSRRLFAAGGLPAPPALHVAGERAGTVFDAGPVTAQVFPRRVVAETYPCAGLNGSCVLPDGHGRHCVSIQSEEV